MLTLKTDDKLRFFVENPAYYQVELVAAAKQELRCHLASTATTKPTVALPAAPRVIAEAARCSRAHRN